MKPESEQLQGQLIEQCEQLTGHVRLLRDFATTPNNVWLARGELNLIRELIGDIEELLTRLKNSQD